MSSLLACHSRLPLASLPSSSFKHSKTIPKSPFFSHKLPFPSLKPLPPKNPHLTITSVGRPLKPVEERFKIQSEKKISKERLEELNVKRWSKWECDRCIYTWEWKVDEQVYIVKGAVQVTPEGCKDSAWFYAGDLVRFPKWFSAHLCFDGEYEQRYRFLAYGDD